VSRRRPAVPARAAVLLSVPVTWLLLAGPALAENGDVLSPREGEDSRSQVTTAQAFLLYVAVPLLIMLVVAALVWLPGVVRGQRYRPQRGTWGAAPVWFAGPPQPEEAVASAQADGSTRGGARGSW
jgi:hypothetical protein